jgi:hypothetical protein
VWFSSPETIASKRPSVLAMVETTLAMVTYGWVAVKWGTLHLTLAACVAPLLLLRTPDSVAKGLDLFERATDYDQPTRKRLALQLLVPWVLLAAAIRFSPLKWWQTALLVLVLAPAIQATAIKVLVTLRGLVTKPREALQAVPGNWWEVVLCTDLLHPPELMPGAVHRYRLPGAKPGAGAVLSPVLMVDLLRTLSRSGWRPVFQFFMELVRSIPRLFRHADTGAQRLQVVAFIPLAFLNLLMIPSVVVTLCISMIPALAYRWSLKGTSLLLSPLAWTVHDGQERTPEHVKESEYFKFTRWYSLAILAVLAAKTSALVGLDLGKVLPEPVREGFAIAKANAVLAAFLSPGTLPWWQVAMAFGAILTFVIYWYADRLTHRGFDDSKKWLLDFGFAVRGVLAVVTMFGLVSVSVSVIRTDSLRHWGLTNPLAKGHIKTASPEGTPGRTTPDGGSR